ncbi:MAG: GNAT family N-acetyltransferase [Eubacteriaceae bacterium]|nr:GNAT family N-acetyltransferase [Eubacteriaceae bacterium]
MIQIRFAEYSDTDSLKQIWRLCFHDDEAYIDFFYANKFKPDQTVLLLENNVISAMLTMLPLSLSSPNFGAFDTRMLYAIATHPDYQGKGLASKLINHCNDLLKEEKVNMSVLVPASKDLFGFYYKLGYIDGFYIRERVLSQEQINDFINLIIDCSIKPIEADEYNFLRNNILKNRANIEYTDDDIAYQKKLSNTASADIFEIIIENTVGCAVIERLSEDKIFIKEILLDEIYLKSALIYVADKFPAAHYIIRTPADMGASIGGNLRPFAVYKPLYSKDDKTPNLAMAASYKPLNDFSDLKEDKTAYLALAFD